QNVVAANESRVAGQQRPPLGFGRFVPAVIGINDGKDGRGINVDSHSSKASARYLSCSTDKSRNPERKRPAASIARLTLSSRLTVPSAVYCSTASRIIWAIDTPLSAASC